MSDTSIKCNCNKNLSKSIKYQLNSDDDKVTTKTSIIYQIQKYNTMILKVKLNYEI